MANYFLVPLKDRPIERLTRCVFGLALFGTGIGMQKAGNLGLPPWDVFHDGVSRIIGLPFGTTIVLTSAFVMLLWIPLRQAPGLGKARTGVEIAVLLAGVALGGSIGVGTIAFAVLIGPIVAKTLPLLQIRSTK